MQDENASHESQQDDSNRPEQSEDAPATQEERVMAEASDETPDKSDANKDLEEAVPADPLPAQ